MDSFLQLDGGYVLLQDFLINATQLTCICCDEIDSMLISKIDHPCMASTIISITHFVLIKLKSLCLWCIMLTWMAAYMKQHGFFFPLCITAYLWIYSIDNALQDTLMLFFLLESSGTCNSLWFYWCCEESATCIPWRYC